MRYSGGITAVTAATYHRAWEHFMTLEPPHGPARLVRSQQVSLRSEAFNVSVQFTDGRNWSSRLMPSGPNWTAMLSGDWTVVAAPGSAGYLEGTNWASAVRVFRDVVGIQKDGSLWVSERPEKLPAVEPPRSSREVLWPVTVPTFSCSCPPPPCRGFSQALRFPDEHFRRPAGQGHPSGAARD